MPKTPLSLQSYSCDFISFGLKNLAYAKAYARFLPMHKSPIFSANATPAKISTSNKYACRTKTGWQARNCSTCSIPQFHTLLRGTHRHWLHAVKITG